MIVASAQRAALNANLSFYYIGNCCFPTPNFVLVPRLLVLDRLRIRVREDEVRGREDENSLLFFCEHFRAAPVRKW